MTEPLRIAVCIKQVLDPEAAPSTLRLDPERLAVSAPGTPPLLNPYDLNALCAALDLRAALSTPSDPGAVITVLSVAASPSKTLLMKTLAAGADRVVALACSAEPDRLLDAGITVDHLAALVDRDGGFDLVLSGRRASDTNRGAVGPLLASRLGVACVTLATAVRPGDPGCVLVDRLNRRGTETLSCALPAVVTVSSEAGDLAATNVRDLVQAKKRPLEVLGPEDLELAPSSDGQRITALATVDTTRECHLVQAGDDRSSGRALAAMLMETVLT